MLFQRNQDSNLKQLINLGLPVIASSFMSMAYNLINIFFVGRLGSDAVAAVGSAGFFLNLSWGVSAMLTVGAGIKVSHSIGEKNPLLAKSYVRSGILATTVLGVVYFILMALTRNFLIGIVGINNPAIEKSASDFLLLSGLSIPFTFLNLFFTNVLISYGDSRSSFRINSAAFVLNIIFDPIFIFVAGLGIQGAAIGTILAEAICTWLFFKKINHIEDLRPAGVTFRKILLMKIVRLGISPTIQRVSFTLISIAMARIISHWGATAIAVQKVGIQIEAISYMTAGGFMSALASISGKAYGAKHYEKQWSAFLSGILLAFIIGIITSAVLIAFPNELFSIFLNDRQSLAMGSEYLVILGFSQLFMCLELMTTGAFFGWGRTNFPAIIGISLTLARIPMALWFIRFWKDSLSSVWWSITISSIAKGTLLMALFYILFHAFMRKHHPAFKEP